jgi:hypothetical protein
MEGVLIMFAIIKTAEQLAQEAYEQALAQARQSRAAAFAAEADPLFFQVQRGEVEQAVYDAKVVEIRQRYPYQAQ